jgi:hypothetical protein
MMARSPFSAQFSASLGIQDIQLSKHAGLASPILTGEPSPRRHIAQKYVHGVAKKLKQINGKRGICQPCIGRLSAMQNNPCLICAVQYIVRYASG